jgi:hypothetical protein
MSRHQGNDADRPTRDWRIYLITRVEDGKAYVGVTQQELRMRFRGHCADAMRDGGVRGRPGTITHAIREAILRGLDPAVAFGVSELSQHSAPGDARRAEAASIARLGTARPQGFNVAPGGASLGAIANAKPIEIDHPSHGRLRFPALSVALAMRNAELARAGQPQLPGSLTYWRVGLGGWSPEEALGYRPHRDGRGERPALRCQGRWFRSLGDAAAATGIPADALRLRLHRARRAGVRDADVATDRRSRGARRARPVPARLPDPREPAGAPLNTSGFARAAGIPKATVIHRLMQLRASGRDPARMSRAALLRALLDRKERRILIALPLPDGRVLRGGVRAVIREVLADPRLKWGRPERIGESAIRARLRKTLAGASPDIPWAFGFAPPGSSEDGQPIAADPDPDPDRARRR